MFLVLLTYIETSFISTLTKEFYQEILPVKGCYDNSTLKDFIQEARFKLWVKNPAKFRP